MESRGAFFREIHKNSWLKRLTAEGKRITVGPKKSDRSWVVFCVHDDTDALLEGYAEPKLAPSHNPEWTLPLHNTQHISHALVHNEKEFEFVITLDSGIFRFHAASWEIMQEWVEVLRQKLREMKILSPRENLYTKLPETRAPLLPTRDPTSPLPATPPVPAAIVPGVECVVTTASPSSSSFSSSSSSPSEVATTTTNSNSVIASAPRNSYDNSSINSDITPASIIQTVAIVYQETPYQSQISQGTSRSDIQSSSQSMITTENNDVNEPVSIENVIKENTPAVEKNSSENSIRVDVIAVTKAETLIGMNTSNYVSSKSKMMLRPELVTTIPTDRAVITTTSAITNYPILNLNKNSDLSNVVDRCKPTTSATGGSNNNSSSSSTSNNSCNNGGSDSTNIMIIQVSNPDLESTSKNYQSRYGEIFKFPPPEHITNLDNNFKSNVHIIPSCLDDISQYSSPIKISSNSNLDVNQQQQVVTTVKVSSNTKPNNNSNELQLQPQQKHSGETINLSPIQQVSKWPEKIILSTNTSGVTNISVGNEAAANISIPSLYDKVFLASSSLSSGLNTPSSIANNLHQQQNLSKNSLPSSSSVSIPSINIAKSKKDNQSVTKGQEVSPSKNTNISSKVITANPSNSNSNSLCTKKENSPLVERKKPKPMERGRENVPPPSLPLLRRPLLTRGVTEAVITARPSRIDVKRNANNSIATTHNTSLSTATVTTTSTVAERTQSESLDRRRRSSSVSETDNQNYYHQQQPQHIQRLQPFRFAQENKSVNVSKKLTLREQQVMQLRREIMHPGGVRLQLRKKDCLGSIAWVDVFGTVWVAGWKQKDHPMLYNALHIGDQLISIAGNPVKCAADANKIIRNSSTLFLEILIRRIPFGRVYAIRREIEGQCLGLIRDGNSATIVDVVPNSLSARHGLTPKAKTCDGLSLTFWVLTEINGRPLNLFCKDNEVHDRLNSVGRDISILVQPLDLITKLRKQLKSIRSFKDYIIQ